MTGWWTSPRVRPRYLVPHHYDMFTFNTVAVEVFEAQARRLPAGVEPRILHCGERGRSRSERYSGHRYRYFGNQDSGHRRAGAILRSASAEYPFAHPHPGWSEQDPELWWTRRSRPCKRYWPRGCSRRPTSRALVSPGRSRLGLPR